MFNRAPEKPLYSPLESLVPWEFPVPSLAREDVVRLGRLHGLPKVGVEVLPLRGGPAMECVWPALGGGFLRRRGAHGPMGTVKPGDIVKFTGRGLGINPLFRVTHARRVDGGFDVEWALHSGHVLKLAHRPRHVYFGPRRSTYPVLEMDMRTAAFDARERVREGDLVMFKVSKVEAWVMFKVLYRRQSDAGRQVWVWKLLNGQPGCPDPRFAALPEADEETVAAYIERFNMRHDPEFWQFTHGEVGVDIGMRAYAVSGPSGTVVVRSLWQAMKMQERYPDRRVLYPRWTPIDG